MTWVLILWLGSSNPTVVQGFKTEAKCEAFVKQIKTPYYSEERKKYQCLKVDPV